MQCFLIKDGTVKGNRANTVSLWLFQELTWGR